MRRFQKLPGECSLLYSPVALLLEDEFTGEAPIERVSLRLQSFDAANGVWSTTDIVPFVSAEGVLSYPGLGRTSNLTVGPRRYRILVASPCYTAAYRRNDSDGLEFTARPFNDQHPLPVDDPDSYARGPDNRADYRYLYPGIRYPFSPQTPALRGTVLTPDGKWAVNHRVDFSTTGRSVTDDRGQFALPFIRLPLKTLWPPTDIHLTRDAEPGDLEIAVERTEGFAADRKIEIEGVQLTVGEIPDPPHGNAEPRGRILKLNDPVPHRWLAGTRVQSLPFNLDISHGSVTYDPVAIKVPDDLRRLKIQLTNPQS